MKAGPAGLHVGIGQVLFVGESDGMDQDIESAPLLLERRENFLDFFVLGHVAGQDNFRADPIGQRPHPLLQHLTSERERQLRALGMKRLCDRPGDAPIVGHAEDRRFLRHRVVPFLFTLPKCFRSVRIFAFLLFTFAFVMQSSLPKILRLAHLMADPARQNKKQIAQPV